MCACTYSNNSYFIHSFCRSRKLTNHSIILLFSTSLIMAMISTGEDLSLLMVTTQIGLWSQEKVFLATEELKICMRTQLTLVYYC